MSSMASDALVDGRSLEHDVDVDHEQLEERELRLRQLDRTRAAHDLARGGVEREVADAEGLAVGPHVRAPKEGAQFHFSLPGSRQLPHLLESRGRALETLIQLLGTSQFFSDLLGNHPNFLDMARGVLTPVMGSRHSIREYLVTSPGTCDIGAADITFCDCIAQRALPARTKESLVVPYRLISPQCIEQIRSIMANS